VKGKNNSRSLRFDLSKIFPREGINTEISHSGNTALPFVISTEA
jgi:hypothetical protein